MPLRAPTIAFAVSAALIVAGGSYATYHWLTGSAALAPSASTGAPAITSEFELVDQTGRTVRDEDLRGKWQLVFFGFTTCPDICPTTLSKVTAALEELGPEATRDLRPLLITVDPERDTPPVLKDYLTAFDPRILGLTGTAEQVGAAFKGFRVYAAKRPLEGGGYTMDHSAFVYLIDPQGEYAAHFLAQIPVEDLVGKLRERLIAS
jgi:protein SCO1/2